MALKRMPGTGNWIYQCSVNGKTWTRSTGESDISRARKVAVQLEQEAKLRRARPETSQRLSQAIVTEVARLAIDVSESAADRAGYSLEQFLLWFGRDVDLGSISSDTLAQFQAERIKLKKASDTIRRDMCAIRVMLAQNGVEVQIPHKPRHVTKTYQRPFTKAELAKFFQACEEDHATAFLFLLCTGARPAEAFPSKRSKHVALLKKELNEADGTVVIRSAKCKPGERPKPPRLISIPADIMARVAELAKRTPEAHVFPENVSLSKLFNRILSRAGIDKKDELGQKLTAHSFRHTYATLLSPSISTFELQRALGHSKIDTTSQYVAPASHAKVIDLSEIVQTRVSASGKKEKEPAKTGS